MLLSAREEAILNSGYVGINVHHCKIAAEDKWKVWLSENTDYGSISPLFFVFLGALMIFSGRVALLGPECFIDLFP